MFQSDAFQNNAFQVLEGLSQSCSGTMTIAGTMARKTSKQLTATTAIAGTLAKKISKAFTATIAIAGVLVTSTISEFTQAIGGTVVISGNPEVLKVTMKTVGSATVAITGMIRKHIGKIISGVVTSAGARTTGENRRLKFVSRTIKALTIKSTLKGG